MSHTYSNLLAHLILSTYNRTPEIVNTIRGDLYAYLGGIVRELRGTALAIGDTRDHVHILLRLPCELAVADCTRLVTTNSSRWIHERWPERRTLSWQTGYAAFSVSESGHGRVVKYIERQEEHHRKMSFQEEIVLLLRKHGVQFDERYLWR